MASMSQSAPVNAVSRRKEVEEYFYFAMSLLFAAIVVIGFSRTVNQNLFHPAIPRPLLLWIHASAFSGWVCFYILQSALVRSHNVKLHRQLGWVGAGLGALMVPLGFTIAVVMGRFDAVELHQSDPTFLSVPFCGITAFGVLLALAISWRRKPELHRRLLFIATCSLLDAAFDRFDFIFYHDLGFVCVDLMILLGVGRDLIVNRRVHAVYRYALPALIVAQVLALYLWHGSPGWWLRTTQALVS